MSTLLGCPALFVTHTPNKFQSDKKKKNHYPISSFVFVTSKKGVNFSSICLCSDLYSSTGNWCHHRGTGHCHDCVVDVLSTER